VARVERGKSGRVEVRRADRRGERSGAVRWGDLTWIVSEKSCELSWAELSGAVRREMRRW
jgi:hypothetical protein